MTEFLILRKGCYFVQGPRRGAVYDLKNGWVCSLDPELTMLLSFAAKGMPFKEALEKVSHGNGPAERLIRKRLTLYSQVMGLEKRRQAFPRIEDVLTSVEGPRYRDGAWLEVTNQCNLACVHCYSMAEADPRNELTLAQWQDALDRLFSLGWTRFSISGGEPFCWPGLLPFIEYILNEPSRTVSVLTNGTMLTGDTIGFLLQHGVAVAITFYSYSPETHDRIAGRQGSWEKTVNGIRRAVEAGLDFSITVPTGALNQDDRNNTLGFLEEVGIGRNRVQITPVFPLGRGCDPHVLPDGEDPFDIRTRGSELRMTDHGMLVYAACWAGKILLKADGGVCLCPLARDGDFVMGNIKERSLESILGDQRLKGFWSLSLDHVEECGKCEFRYGCRDCRPASHMYTGQLFMKDPNCSYDPRTGEWKTRSNKECTVGSSIWTRTGKYTVRPLGDDLILLDENDKTIHLLNRVGAKIYHLLDGQRSVEDMVVHLMGLYHVEEARLRADVQKILKELEGLGAVSLVGGE